MRQEFEKYLLKNKNFTKKDLQRAGSTYADPVIAFLWQTYQEGGNEARASAFRFIVGRKYSEGVYIFSNRPVWHQTFDEARKEANRLVDKHKATFVVFSERKVYGEQYLKGETSVKEGIEEHKADVQA